MGLKGPLLSISLLGIGLGAALAVTNPTPDDFVDFATLRASDYLRQQACTSPIPIIGRSFEDECIAAVDSENVQNRIRKLVAEGSERKDYILFSRYRTELSLHSFLPIDPLQDFPAYQVETLAILDQFHIYQSGSQATPVVELQ
ncbi:MAG: DUF4359 domain-containing protein [Cyanobacteria bacterium P01_H01_bin.121]